MKLVQEVITARRSGMWQVPRGVYWVDVYARHLTDQQISAGNNFGLGLIEAPELGGYGRAVAWGTNQSGQHGTGGILNQSNPTIIPVLASLPVIQVAAGTAFSLWLTATGEIYSAGLNDLGQMGDGTIVTKSVPTLITSATLGRKFVLIRAAGKTAYALSATGGCYSWGINNNGQHAQGDILNRSVPTFISAIGYIKDIYTGYSDSTATETISTYFIRSNGDVYAVGSNTHGQFGDGTVTTRSIPVLAVRGLDIEKVAVGNGFALFLTRYGKVYASGLNGDGQLGLGDVVDRSTPTLVTGLGSAFVRDIFAGTASSYAIRDEGSLLGWGSQNKGALGNNTSSGAISTPTLLVGNNLGIVVAQVAAGGNKNAGEFLIINTSMGFRFGSGVNLGGQIADNTIVSKSVATVISGFQGVLGIVTPTKLSRIPTVPGEKLRINMPDMDAAGGDTYGGVARMNFGRYPVGYVTQQQLVLQYFKPEAM